MKKTFLSPGFYHTIIIQNKYQYLGNSKKHMLQLYHKRKPTDFTQIGIDVSNDAKGKKKIPCGMHRFK